jgi:hypothetical protein
MGMSELGLNQEHCGLEGSPTRVGTISKPKVTRNGTICDSAKTGVANAVSQLCDYLETKNLL